MRVYVCAHAPCRVQTASCPVDGCEPLYTFDLSTYVLMSHSWFTLHLASSFLTAGRRLIHGVTGLPVAAGEPSQTKGHTISCHCRGCYCLNTCFQHFSGSWTYFSKTLANKREMREFSFRSAGCVLFQTPHFNKPHPTNVF